MNVTLAYMVAQNLVLLYFTFFSPDRKSVV